MGRTKQTARRSPAQDQSRFIGSEDPLPTAFIDCIRYLPLYESHDATVVDEHPAKRRKVDAVAVSSICVATGTISFTRPRADDLAISFSEIRRDVGSSLGLFSLGDGKIKLDVKKNSSAKSTNVKVSLRPEYMDDNVKDILRICPPRSENLSPGAIWTKANLFLETKRDFIKVDIQVELFWNQTPSPANGFRRADHRKATQDLIDTFYPRVDAPVAAWSPMDFYDAASVPDKGDALPLSIEIPGMDATLFPYQKRTVQWLLGREGMSWSGKDVQPSLELKTAPVSESSRPVQDLRGKKVFLSDILHTISFDNRPFCDVEKQIRGGILAEEMGLGKTIEILGLILLNRRPLSQLTTIEDRASERISSGATLIVTPESLRAQWMTEISKHAPGLRFEFYQGCKREKDAEDVVAQRLSKCDVVLTTYHILSAELHFTEDPPERSRRRERKYERQKSPLTEIEWWRLCLDEAQMIENGISKAATVARTIPRVNSWGITGTPVKDDVKDLYGLLSFLRYAPLASAPQGWQALVSGHKSVFQQLFGTLSLRHTKALVRDEISLPPQRRFAISVPFTAVEEQHYQSLFKEMTEACGLDGLGNPVVEDWDPDDFEEDMRVWLNRLRQTALHPEVGLYSRRVLGQGRSRPMRTVEEVLDAMIDQSDMTLKADYRTLLANKLTRGQLFENSPRVKEALSIWEDARKETEKLVLEAREEMKATIKENRASTTANQVAEEPEESSSDEDQEEAGTRGREGESRRKLRSALEMHHKAVFFCANAFFQIRENKDMTIPESEEFENLKKKEDEEYEKAKSIRREILRESHKKATKLMTKLSQKAAGQTFTEVSELAVSNDKGIESSRIVDNLEVLYGELNQQANVIDEWREHAVQLLLKPLVDEEDEVETTGEEMIDAVQIQDELIVYVQALRAAIADRHDAMTGQTNELVSYEAQTSIRLAKDGEGPMPEKMLAMLQLRSEIKPQIADTSMRGAMSELRSLVTRLRNEPNQTDRVRVELKLATKHLQETQDALNEQTKASTALETEIESFTTTMNARLAYYRQLQSVSDSVAPYEGSKTEETVARMLQNEEDLSRKLAVAESKHRYLLHLKDAGARSSEPRMCVICQTTFETGVLTVCGHQFCKQCMMMWYKAHRNCPMCKRHLTPFQLHDITIKPQELKLHGDEKRQTNGDSEGSPRHDKDVSKKGMIYSTFNSDKLAEIKDIELDGPSYTTKVDTLVRHLLWLRQTDPGAKSIVFSQYKDFLGVLGTAFRRFRINYASIDTHGGATRFKEDPAVEVFLLHARAHSSGLNLVNANNVFLCEPLVNTALELQAIARVDRIGQQHETTVWLYITSGTVEESIYNLSVKRRMEHLSSADRKGKSKEPTPELLDVNLEAANTLELEQAALTKLMSKDKTAGEVVDKGDLWECLFGHMTDKPAPNNAKLVVR